MKKLNWGMAIAIVFVSVIISMMLDGSDLLFFGMAISNFIPEVWSARLLTAFRRARRWRTAVTDVSDEIERQGDTIHVGEVVSSVTIRDYSKTTDLADPEIQTDYDDSFTISQMKYFNIGVNDVDRVQSQPALLPRFTNEAGYQLALTHDAYVRGLYIGGTTGNNSLLVTKPNGKTKASAAADTLRKQRLIIAGVENGGVGGNTDRATYVKACTALAEELFFLQKVLLDLNWPIGEDTGGESGQGGGPGVYAFCNTKTYEALTFYLLNLTGGSGSIQDAAVRGGFMRQLFGFNLVPDPGMSNANAAANKIGQPQILIGMPDAIYLAEQIRQTEAYRPEKRFQDAVKGLSVYGGKRVDASKLFAVIAAKGTALTNSNDVNGDA